MKKLVLAIAFILVSFGMNAQTFIGGGMSYLGDMGVEVNSEFGISDGMLTLSPSLDYYFPGENVTSLAFNFDGHYNLGDVEDTNYYPIAGLNYYYFSYDIPKITNPYTGETVGGGSVSDGKIGFNLGFGVNFPITDSMKLYGEAKFVLNDYADDFGIAAGILFNIGG